MTLDWISPRRAGALALVLIVLTLRYAPKEVPLGGAAMELSLRSATKEARWADAPKEACVESASKEARAPTSSTPRRPEQPRCRVRVSLRPRCRSQ